MNSLRSYVRKTLQLNAPLRTASKVWSERHVFIIRYEASGVVGWGEASPLEGWGSETEEICAAQLDRWVEYGERPTAPSASFGVDVAILDHSARRQEQPLWRFLGGKSGVLTCHDTIGATAKAETIRQVGLAVDAGFHTVKLKVGADSVQDDIRRVSEVFRSYPTVRLRLDANAGWTLEAAARFVEGIRGANIDYLEQPLMVGDVEGLVELRKLGVSVAADEGANSEFMRTELVEAKAVDVIVVKPSVFGPVSSLRDEVSRLSAAGIRVVFSSAIESAIGRNAVAHVIAGIGTREPAGLNTGKWLKEDLAPSIVGNAESILVGLGIGASPGLKEQIHES